MVKDWRTNVIQVGGILGAGLVGGLIAVLANATYRGGADAGDWLQFFGGMIGAALAVFGAVYFESKRRRDDRNMRLKRIHMFLLDLQNYLQAIPYIQRDRDRDIWIYRASVELALSRIDVSLSYLSGIALEEISHLDTLRSIYDLKVMLTTWRDDMREMLDDDVMIMDHDYREATFLWSSCVLKSLDECLQVIAAFRHNRETVWTVDYKRILDEVERG